MDNENLKYDKKSFVFLTSFYMVLITFVIQIFAFLSLRIQFILIVIIFIVVLLLSIYLWKRELSKNILYFHNILNALGAISLGYMISSIMENLLTLFFAYIVYIAVIDIFSFTKKGKNTSNAKLMNNKNHLARLSICLPIPDYKGLLPIIGVGDLFYYSIIITTSVRAWGEKWISYTLGAVLLGQALNVLFYVIFKSKKWYKGIPATAFPGFIFLLTAFLIIL